MEVDKIAINDNFSSENRKNIPTNSANEQDIRIFKSFLIHIRGKQIYKNKRGK